MTITEFLSARYDEEEVAATEAAHRSADWAERGTWFLEGVEHNVVGDEEAFCHPHNVAHIVRHGPARVLREVKAKRKIVERCEPGPQEEPLTRSDMALGYEDGIRAAEAQQLIILRELASVYADHPDYDQEWTP